MSLNSNTGSFTTRTPKSGLFGSLPTGIDSEAGYFRRQGASFAFQRGDRVGMSPMLRMMPLFALIILASCGVTLMIRLANLENLGHYEIAATIGICLLIFAMSFGLSWLLKDLTRAAIVDNSQATLWLGGGWMGSWDAINYSIIQHVKVARIASDIEAEYPWAIVVVDMDRVEYRICEEMTAEFANTAGKELAGRMGMSFIPQKLHVG
ncbi:MAG: hypothetical protein HRU15_02475 [Planctomycetes bacterium]|nr:hypothetical protein [Planctomycetota bacterium]